MSTSYFITPYDPKAWEDPDDTSPKPTSDLRIDPIDFVAKLRERWPGIKFETHIYEGLRWTFPLPPEIEGNFVGASGGLFNHAQVISLGSEYDGLFQGFLLWYRAYIPATYRLWFFNSSSWDRLELTKDTTDEDIVNFRRDYGV